MRISSTLRSGIVITVLCLVASAQSTPATTPGKEVQASEGRGIPPRAAPTDYQAHAAAGTVTVAAEFVGHSVPTPQGIFSSEDYVVVETALFGPADARLQISFEDFALRINEKKTPLPSQPFGMVFRSLKDPEWSRLFPPNRNRKAASTRAEKGETPACASSHAASATARHGTKGSKGLVARRGPPAAASRIDILSVPWQGAGHSFDRAYVYRRSRQNHFDASAVTPASHNTCLRRG